MPWLSLFQITPCDWLDIQPLSPLVQLSCAAADHNISIVFNSCEMHYDQSLVKYPNVVQSDTPSTSADAILIHNTEFVLDKTGRLLTRYIGSIVFTDCKLIYIPEIHTSHVRLVCVY